jgi:transcriptional regulator with XRE-family HTH domain
MEQTPRQALLAAMYRRGLTLRDIAYEIGINRRTIQRFLHDGKGSQVLADMLAQWADPAADFPEEQEGSAQ